MEYDRVNAGMEEFHTKMKAIADNKEQKTKRQKKIMKYAQAYLKIFLLCFRQRLIAKQDFLYLFSVACSRLYYLVKIQHETP